MKNNRKDFIKKGGTIAVAISGSGLKVYNDTVIP